MIQLAWYNNFVSLLNVQDENLLNDLFILYCYLDIVRLAVAGEDLQIFEQTNLLMEFAELLALQFVVDEVARRPKLIHFVVVKPEILKNIEALRFVSCTLHPFEDYVAHLNFVVSLFLFFLLVILLLEQIFDLFSCLLEQENINCFNIR